jgi:hypothetical protein
MLEGSSPDLLRTLLHELDDEVRARGVDVDAWAAPGIPHEVARRTLSSVGLSLPAEVAVWFEWHNGLNPEGPRGFPYPNFENASIDEAVRRYRETRAFIAPAGPADPPAEALELGVGEGWLRLVSSNYGLAVDCSTNEDIPRIRNAEDDFFFEPERYRARSLCTFVAWRLYGIRNGAYRWEGEGRGWAIDGLHLHPSQAAAGFS